MYPKKIKCTAIALESSSDGRFLKGKEYSGWIEDRTDGLESFHTELDEAGDPNGWWEGNFLITLDSLELEIKKIKIEIYGTH